MIHLMNDEWHVAQHIMNIIKHNEFKHEQRAMIVSTKHGLMNVAAFKAQREEDGIAEIAAMLPDTY